jgi:hypothetical protein
MLNQQQIEALYQLYPQAVRTDGDNAYDTENNLISYDLNLVTTQANKNVCKQKASFLLYETDWTTIPDVANSENSPYLTNQAEFITYRNTVRKYAVNPVENPNFPTEPTPVWA